MDYEREPLPTEDGADWGAAQRGFIAPPPGPLRTARGLPLWDLSPYAFLEQEDAPPTVHPSLWRMARLNLHAGLFEVCPRVYQLRGMDLANMTIVEGENGLIVMDCLTTAEVARAALDLYFQHRPQRPITSVIYTHSHVDHFGGALGVITPGAGIPVLAPDGFMEAVGGENILAGPAMTRRAQFQFGGLLSPGPRGQVDAGLGKTTARGTVGLVAPTDLIRTDLETRVIDGVEITFQLAPETEAPAEMHLFLPQFGLLNMAENTSRHLHNFLPLRGAVVRDPRRWAAEIDRALVLFADRTDILIGQHHWPTWGRAAIRDFLEKQRDLYKFIHDQTLRLLNLGLTPTEIAEALVLPPPLAREWYLRGYYGTVRHNAKAVYQRYLGWYDGHPASLNPHPPRARALRLVRALGGLEATLDQVRQALGEGDARWAAELAAEAVRATPGSGEARALAAEAFDQLGFAEESATWRNAYLYAAQELREGPRTLPPRPVISPELLAATPSALLFDFLAARLDPQRAGPLRATLGWTLPERGESFTLILSNAVLTVRAGAPAEAEAQVTTDRATLDALALGRLTVEAALAEGRLAVEGEGGLPARLFALFNDFPLMFDVLGIGPRAGDEAT